jgi:hypothetical protein
LILLSRATNTCFKTEFMLDYFQSVLIGKYVPKDHAKKTYEEMKVSLHAFLASAQNVGE